MYDVVLYKRYFDRKTIDKQMVKYSSKVNCMFYLFIYLFIYLARVDHSATWLLSRGSLVIEM